MEAPGKVCVATLFNGGITVIDDPSGAYEHIPFPDPVTSNICFGDPRGDPPQPIC